MFTIFLNFELDTFLISTVNFGKDLYDDLESGYYNREGEMLVYLMIYNLFTNRYEIYDWYYLFRIKMILCYHID